MIKQKVCPKCGYDAYIQADLRWDEDKQDWKVVWTDDTIHCAKCFHEYHLKDVKDVM